MICRDTRPFTGDSGVEDGQKALGDWDLDAERAVTEWPGKRGTERKYVALFDRQKRR